MAAWGDSHVELPKERFTQSHRTRVCAWCEGAFVVPLVKHANGRFTYSIRKYCNTKCRTEKYSATACKANYNELKLPPEQRKRMKRDFSAIGKLGGKPAHKKVKNGKTNLS